MSAVPAVPGVAQASNVGLQGGSASILTNPNTVINIPGAKPAAPAPAPASTPAASGSSGGSNFNAPQYIEGIRQEYEGQLAGNQRQAEANDANYGVNKNLIEQQYGANSNQITQNAADSINTLETQKGGVQGGQKLALTNLADQTHGAHQALLNELGTVGAGSSSAVLAGENALARVQNSNRAGIQQNAGSEMANIDAEEQAVNDQKKTQLDILETWRSQQLQQILQTYQQNQNAIEQALQTAQGEEKARLAEFGQTLTTATSAALQALDKTVTNHVAQITQSQVAAAPTIQAPQKFQAPAPITSPTVSPFNAGNAGGNSNTTATPAGGSIYALVKNNQQ